MYRFYVFLSNWEESRIVFFALVLVLMVIFHIYYSCIVIFKISQMVILFPAMVQINFFLLIHVGVITIQFIWICGIILYISTRLNRVLRNAELIYKVRLICYKYTVLFGCGLIFIIPPFESINIRAIHNICWKVIPLEFGGQSSRRKSFSQFVQ